VCRMTTSLSSPFPFFLSLLSSPFPFFIVNLQTNELYKRRCEQI
jgi:hypothetical protein